MKKIIVVNSSTNKVTVKNAGYDSAVTKATNLLNKAVSLMTAGEYKKAGEAAGEVGFILARAGVDVHKFKVGDHVKIKDDASVSPQRDFKEYAGRTGTITGYDRHMGDGQWPTVKFDKPYIVPEGKGGPFTIREVQVHESGLKKA